MTARRYVVSGTDTGVGKTVFAAGLAAALGADYWKPVQAGLVDETDSDMVARLVGEAPVRIHAEAYRLASPCSPHAAARSDDCRIELSRLVLPESEKGLVVEGAGGVLVPYRDDLLAADIFAWWGLPVILVARTTLGTINHSLLSIEALRSREVELAGVVFVGDAEAVAEEAITWIGRCAHLGRLPWIDPLDHGTLSQAFAENVRTELLT